MFLLVSKMILISFSNLFIFLYPIIHFISVCFIYHNSFRPSLFISFILFITIVLFRSSPLFRFIHHHHSVSFITIILSCPSLPLSPLFRSVHHYWLHSIYHHRFHSVHPFHLLPSVPFHSSVLFITIVPFCSSPSFCSIHHHRSVLFITIIPFCSSSSFHFIHYY